MTFPSFFQEKGRDYSDKWNDMFERTLKSL